MKKLHLLILLLAATCLATPSLAGCPDMDGVFSYTTGSMLGGHITESWCGGSPGQTGNTSNAMSWDGTSLGTQWRVWDMQIDAAGAQMTYDGVDAMGNGSRAYQTGYLGGSFWLSKDGDWGDSINDITGVITTATVSIMFTYVNNVAVGANSNIYFAGSVEDCPNGCVIEYAIANAALMGTITDGMALPADYPPFLCNATSGEIFDALTITMEIDCVVAEEATTWGSVKAQYK